MDKNEIFKTVAEHLIGMTVQSVNNGVCLYRGPNGLKCAAGVLIPDDLYKKYDIEGLGFDEVLRKWNDFKIEYPNWMRDNYEIIVDLQEVHDGFIEDKLERLIDVAEKYRISSEYIPNELKMGFDYDQE